MKLNTFTLALRILFIYRNGYMFFLEKLKLIPNQGHTTYVLWNGMRYKCRRGTSDFAILNETTILHEYEKVTYDNLNSSSLVLDFGGQAGDFSIYTAYTKKCQVFAFEPDQGNIELFTENIRLNNLQGRITLVGKAVSNTDEDKTFYLSPHENKGVHSFFYKGPIPVTVKCITPTQILELTGNKQIDFLKMDIEGGEHELVGEHNKTFFDKIQTLVMEYHCQAHVENRQELEELVKKLEILGFNVTTEGTPELGLLTATRS